jgi:hypothetical protein
VLAKPVDGIASRKSWAYVVFKHSKTTFYLVVMSKSTFMYWTILLKRIFAKTCWTLGWTVSLLAKLLKLKVWIMSWKSSKALSKSESISHTPLSLNMILQNSRLDSENYEDIWGSLYCPIIIKNILYELSHLKTDQSLI